MPFQKYILCNYLWLKCIHCMNNLLIYNTTEWGIRVQPLTGHFIIAHSQMCNASCFPKMIYINRVFVKWYIQPIYSITISLEYGSGMMENQFLFQILKFISLTFYTYVYNIFSYCPLVKWNQNFISINKIKQYQII